MGRRRHRLGARVRVRGLGLEYGVYIAAVESQHSQLRDGLGQVRARPPRPQGPPEGHQEDQYFQSNVGLGHC